MYGVAPPAEGDYDVKRLIAYLRDNLIVDFQGDLSVENVRELLGDDDSRDARTLLARLVEDGKVDDMMLVLADCLVDKVRDSLGDDLIREHLRSYSES